MIFFHIDRVAISKATFAPIRSRRQTLLVGHKLRNGFHAHRLRAALA
jgi:hypothetical protein